MGDLRVRVLGSFEVEGVESHRLGARKGRTLLKVLALARGRPVGVDRLVDCLWPAGAPARPAVQVAVLVSRARSVLGADRLPRSDAGYALLADWLDLDAMAALAEEASRRLTAGSWAAARAAAAGALMLDRGALLIDEPDAPWTEVDRAAAARLVAQARHTAALAALAAGDPLAGAELAEGLLDHDPYDEAALRTLMTAHSAAGRPASALAAYARVRSRLAEELGVDPTPATEAVHAAILREEPIPGVVVGDTSREPAGPVVMEDGVAPLPGRQAELAALDAALAGAAGGRLVVAAVEGEAGMGKTRLLSVWSARARNQGAAVLAGRCDELDRTLPLEAIFDALGRHLRAVGPEPAAGLLGSDAPTLAPLLGRRLGGVGAGPGGDAGPSPPVAALADPTTGRAVLFDALLGVLTRVAGDGPVVLILDDAHLAGAFTMDWLRFAVHRVPHLALLVVAARRPEEGPALPATVTVTLGPLDLAAAEAVVGPERAGDLYARSGGHPLFLIELAAADPGDELPASIREAVAERCDRAGPAAATLRAAAVLGPVIDLDLLAAVLRLPPVALLDHLEEGVRHRFLVESEAGFEFGHDLVREALAAGVGASRRALAHREAARALAERPRSDPLLIAYHARLGGDHERAAAGLTQAARLASGLYDHADAERRLDQALALSDLPEIRLERARARILRLDFAGAAEDAGVALQQGGGAPALEVGGWAAYYQRDFNLARRLADDGARLAEDPQLRASCLSLAGYVRTTDGDLAGAEAQLDEAARLAHGPALVVAAALKGNLLVYQGRLEEGLDLLHPVTLPGAPTPGFFGLRARATLGYGLAVVGRAAEAMAAFDELEAEMDRRGTERYRGFVANSRGWVLRNLGEATAADEANRQSLEEAERFARSDPRISTEWRIHGLLDLASGRLLAGDLDGARSCLTDAEPLNRVEHAMHWRTQLRSRLLSGRLALAEGDLDEVQAAAAELAEEAGCLGVDRYLAPARLLEAQARAVAGETVDREEVGRLLEALPRTAGLEAWWITAEVAAAIGVDAWWALAEQRVARLAEAAGDHAETLRRYAGALLESMKATGLKL